MHFRKTLLVLALSLVFAVSASAAVMNDYCIQPTFVSQTVPPLVMFEMGRDHKFYFQAYNDATDLDGDGKIDSKYTHTINYYGYFDPFKCYSHSGGSGNTDKFTPVSVSSNKLCSGGQWSGNALNWLTMTRLDVLKKVLYGGQRSSDSNTTTELKRVPVPPDAHSWGKELTGRLCYDGTGTYTTTCAKNSDCNSGWTCNDVSQRLIAMDAADAPSACGAGVAVPGWTTNGILVTKYAHPSSPGVCGDYTINVTDPPVDCPECPPTINIVDGIFNSYEPTGTNLLDYFYISGFDANSATTPPKDVLPEKDHGTDFNFFMVSRFDVTAAAKGEWQFLVDSDDGAYVMVDGVIVSNYPGCHGRCYDVPGGRDPNNPARAKVCSGTIAGPAVKGCNTDADCNVVGDGICQLNTPVCANTIQPIPQPGKISLTAGTHQLVVRHAEQGGQDGVRVWYKTKPADAWKIFNNTNLTLKAPAVTAANQCSITTLPFIETGSPAVGVEKRHLFCNTTLSDGGQPLLRYVQNRTERIWQWSTMESGDGPSCGSKIYNSAADDKFSATSVIAPVDRTVQVEVCKSSGVTGGFMAEDYEFERCKNYAGTYKPIGLLQKYGETFGGAQVCSKSMTRPCGPSLPACNLATEGLCVYKSDMFYGLFTTNYENNKSGGSLRKNISSIIDETGDNTGILATSEKDAGNIILSIDRMKIVDFDYTKKLYKNCAFNDRPMAEKECRDWGNPIAEMMYESLRYLAGKSAPLDAFKDATPAAAGVKLSTPPWGKLDTGGARYKPYSIYPSCAKSFLLLLSDINTSFDDDQVPGSAFNTYAEDAETPLLNMNVAALANTIGTAEGIAGNNWFIGETSSLNNFLCDSKTVSNLSLIRGTCPEEPTKKGSFYSAAVAYYGKTQFKNNTGLPNVNTFAVALSSPMADLKFKVGGKLITFVPVGKSVSGTSAKAKCADLCTMSIDNSAKGLTVSNCGSGSFCPTNAIVNTFIEETRYDNGNNLTYARFRINYENYEQGNDFDMDALVRYEVCTASSVNQDYSFCTTALNADQIEIKVDSRAASGGTDQALGFVMSGTTADGSYLVVKDADVAASSPINNLPLSFQRTFTTSSTGSTTGILKNPLWYAAKWGGFEDSNGNGVPDQKREWAKNCTESDVTKCNPDNYYLVNNPLELERQLDTALRDILKRVTSGTAASILNNSEGSGANLLQAVFYPKKSFDDSTEADWIGELQNLWYFIDPFFNRSTVRVDSDSNFSLDLKQDYIAKFRFDSSQNQTFVDLVQDVNGDGSVLSAPVSYASDDPNVKSLWRAGRMLWERNLTSDPRNIYTVTAAASGSPLRLMVNNGAFNAEGTVTNLLQASTVDSGVEAGKIINFLSGIDQPSSGYRNRTVTISGCGLTDVQGCTREWKLGDIVNSTPRLESTVRLNTYNLEPSSGYGDTSYSTFFKSNNYKRRGMAYVGANDGMLHAFKLGILDVSGTTKNHKAKIINADGSAATSASNLGREEWAFVPRNVLPYLKYMTDSNYKHLFYVDNTATIFDASIHAPGDNNGASFPSCTASTYWNCEKKTAVDGIGNLVMDNTSWRTILVGGMGFGGASRNSNTLALAGGGCDDKVSTGTCVKSPIPDVGYSSYFALDVTNPHVLPGTNATDEVKFLWEFNGDPANNDYLGYTTSGPAIVRVGPKGTNGKWFAVFASGPSGPIDTNSNQFFAKSDQRLKIFIVDLVSGALLRTIDAGAAPNNVTNAFAGSISGSVSDNDKWNRTSSGFYSDDVVYIGYVKADTSVTPNTWTQGGVLRLLTKESLDPNQWVLSKVIDNIGPVTTAVTKLQGRFDTYDKTKLTAATGKFWLYFGTGRYFYKADALNNQYHLFGIEEPCYSNNSGYPNFTPTGINNEFDTSCTETVAVSDLQSQSGNATTSALQTLPLDKRGWYVSLDNSTLNDGYSSERVITNPVASTAGAVFYTTFRPTADICGYGGNSYIWALKYDSGGEPPAAAMKGKALMQVSTGALAEISLSEAFNSSTNNKRYDNRRLDQPISGMPPSANGLALITNPKPVKKMLHSQEK